MSVLGLSILWLVLLCNIVARFFKAVTAIHLLKTILQKSGKTFQFSQKKLLDLDVEQESLPPYQNNCCKSPRHGIPLLLKGGPQIIEVLRNSYEPLGGYSVDSTLEKEWKWSTHI